LLILFIFYIFNLINNIYYCYNYYYYYFIILDIEIERNEAENLANQLSEKKKLKINLLSKRDELILMKKELEKKLSKKKEGIHNKIIN